MDRSQPFGLVNAPATYQRLMTLILGNLQWQCVCVYVDDCLVYSPSWEQHLRDLAAVLDRFQQAGVSLKLSKCRFAQRQVKYLGIMLSGDGQSTDPAAIKKVIDTPAPSNHSELRSFMGLVNYYRQFLLHFVEVAEPLLELQRYEPSSPTISVIKGSKKKAIRNCNYRPKPWSWTSAHQQAFDALKRLLTKAPVLVYPDYSGKYPFILETDASGVGLGAVLSQRYPDGDHPIGYFSCTLKDKERGWSATEREAYAVLKATRNFRHILYGSPFTVVTDHASLRYLLDMKDPFGRIGRWIMELQQYQLSVEHRSGKSHNNADSLSRPPIVQPDAVDASSDPGDVEDENINLRDLLANVDIIRDADPTESHSTTTTINSTSITSSGLSPTNSRPSPPSSSPITTSSASSVEMPTNDQIQEMQRQDPVLMGYITYLQDRSFKNVPADIQPLLLDLSNYSLIDGTLYHTWHISTTTSPDQPTSRIRLVVPEPMRKAILTAHHENILAGHRGFHGTYYRLRRNYFWPGMRADVHAWVASCLACARRKSDRRGATTGLKGIPGGDRPFSAISMDFMGPLPVTPRGNKYILVVNDYATRFVCAFGLPNADASTVAETLVERIFLEYGPADKILSDRGSHFNNALIEAILQLFMVRQVFSSGYRPQTAGITERMNQTLLDILAMYVDRRQRDWDKLLPYVLFAYRTLYNPVVKHVPFYLLFGYEPILPHELPLLLPHLNQSDADRQWNVVAQRLNVARKLAREAVQRVHAATQERADANRRDPPAYKYGDLVMALQPVVAPGGTLKLAPEVYQGPYKVERYQPGFRTLKLTHTVTGAPRLAHIDNVKPYRPSPLRDAIPPAPEPQPSEADQRKAIEMLERACTMAKHIVGQGRARATVSHILGSTGLTPLPPEIHAAMDVRPRPSSARRPSILKKHTASKSSTSKKQSRHQATFAHRPSQSRSSPPPSSHQRVVQHSSAPWKPSRNNLSSWFDQLSQQQDPSAPTTRYGRPIRHRL